MIILKKYVPGIALTALLALAATAVSGLIPQGVVGASVFALLIGMLLNPLVAVRSFLTEGVAFVSKKVLRLAIILMGLTLSFSQVLSVGGYSLLVMCFTLLTAFGGGCLLGKALGMDWKLSGLISAGTGICGGSAIAAISPVIEARDEDVAYAIAATFLFDIAMVILFPLAGRFFNMSDLGYGLWAGTAVNDTSSVVAAGYAFSDAAGAYSVIVKLTRTLSIVPVVLLFSLAHGRVQRREAAAQGGDVAERKKIDILKIFPHFILLFLAMVVIKSTGIIPDAVSAHVSTVSKFLMTMALGAIGIKTNFRKMAKSGAKPMFHGFIISALVVVVSFLVQLWLGQV